MKCPYVKCPYCGSDKIDTTYKTTDLEEVRFYRCNGCDDRFLPEDIERD